MTENAEIKISIKYTDTLESVSVNGSELDISTIKDKPIEQWFSPSTGRDGWGGLIPTIKDRANDYSAKLIFDFKGPLDVREEFSRCLKKQKDSKNTSIEEYQNIIQKELEKAKNFFEKKEYKKAYKCYVEASERGDLSAQLKAGEYSLKCFNGKLDLGLSKEDAINNAIKFYGIAAEKNNSEAQYFLAKCYYSKNNVVAEKDLNQALKYYQMSAEQGYLPAQYCLGEYYYNLDSKSADKNKKNKKIAFDWYSLVVKQTPSDFLEMFIASLKVLAKCYELGIGNEKSIGNAFNFYKKAAELGDSYAQFRLAEFYENDVWCMKNEKEAFEWYLKSAKQGYFEAQYKVGEYYEKKSNVIGKNYMLAYEWYNRAAELGHAEAQCSIARLYENGLGVKKDIEVAIEYYKKAGKNENADALYRLGYLYEK